MIVVIINNVIVFTGISGFLALLLVIADYFLANYGECKIDVNGKKQFTVSGGNSLLNSLAENELYVSSACGGKGTCGLCKIKAIEGCGPLLPTEKPYLDKKELEDNVRLSCQIKVKQDIVIRVPEELFSVKKYQGLVTELSDYTYDIKKLIIKLKEPSEIEFKAGQYVQLESKKYSKAKQPVMRAYSVASSPEHRDYIELIIRKVPDGIMTTYVHDYLKQNDNISFTGPFGDFYIRETDADMLFVAGGSGMAPFKAILEELNNQDTERRIVYFFGARTKKDLFLVEEMKEYEKRMKDFTFVPVLSHPDADSDWDGITGYIPPLLEKYLKDSKKTEGYLCGSPGLLAATEKQMTQLGIEKVYYDSFG